jgi:alpha-L-rhamnosidase
MTYQLDNTLTNFPRSRSWRGNWIWHPHAPRRNAWVLFRHDFEIAETAGAKLYISADTRYRVWINGVLLGDGPPQSQPYHQYYDDRDISHCLQVGGNSIAVVVHHQGVQDSARGGLLAEIVSRGNVVSSTGERWRCRIGNAWRVDTNYCEMNRIGPFQEQVDLRQIPFGWDRAGFDDRSWDAPTVLPEGAGTKEPPLVMPWCRLIPRDIAFISENNVYPTEIQKLEECIDLATRRSPGDISMSLSQVGRPVDWAVARNVDELLSEDGETILACSNRHLDGIADGRYDPCLTLDFGCVLTGYAEIEVDAPAGARIEIGYAERLIDDHFNISIECPFADSATIAEGKQVFRPLVWRSFRYLRIRLKDCETQLKVHAVRAVAVDYPFEERGVYHGNKRMEQIFEICRTTLRLCSIESLMDTPYREQAQWLGDVAAVTIPAIYACFGDTALAGKFIRQSAMNTKPTGLIANISNVSSNNWEHDIPDYSLWWVMCLWNHYNYSGDPRFIHECYPEMQRIMRSHLERVGPDGLIDQLFGWVFIDWANVDTHGASAAYNAIFAGACDAAGKIAALKGDTWAETVYTAAAKGIRAAYRDKFLDVETGLLVDAVHNERRSDRFSEHGNTSAIAFDCVDEETADRIIAALFENKSVPTIEAQPFFMVVVLEALRKRNRLDIALKLIDERWGERMIDRGYTSCTEEWYQNGSWRDGSWQGFQRTHSHAWSACPAEFLITGLAGIRILEPGCSTLRVAPYESSEPYQVVFPTPKGEVHVDWNGKAAIISAPDDIELV